MVGKNENGSPMSFRISHTVRFLGDPAEDISESSENHATHPSLKISVNRSRADFFPDIQSSS